MSPYLAEVLGTCMFVFIGTSCIANAFLSKTKGSGQDLLFVFTGFSLAVTLAVMIFGPTSGAHFNPAVTLALAITGVFPWAQVPGYIVCQILGGFCAGCLTYTFHRLHFAATTDAEITLAVFATGPAIRNYPQSLLCEAMATFIMMFAILGATQTTSQDPSGTLQAFTIGGIIMAIGTGLGGTTGFAINPARDLGPRIAYMVLPIKCKRDPDWGYSWVPIIGPIIGGVLGAVAAGALFG